MNLKKKTALFLKTVGVCVFCLSLFVGVGYFYLDSKTQTVQNEAPSVPYYSSVPENAGVLLDIAGSKTLYYLDFENMTMAVIFADNEAIDNNEIYGYQVDYTVMADYPLLASIVDMAGGINLEAEGEMLSFTGVQVADMLSVSTDFDTLRREVTKKTLDGIRQNGMEKEDLLYIIENSETDLTVPDCYFWADYIKDICKTVRIVN